MGAAQGTGVVAWTGFGVTLSLATPAQGLQPWCCGSCCQQEGPGKSRAAVAEPDQAGVSGASSTSRAADALNSSRAGEWLSPSLGKL